MTSTYHDFNEMERSLFFAPRWIAEMPIWWDRVYANWDAPEHYDMSEAEAAGLTARSITNCPGQNLYEPIDAVVPRVQAAKAKNDADRTKKDAEWMAQQERRAHWKSTIIKTEPIPPSEVEQFVDAAIVAVGKPRQRYRSPRYPESTPRQLKQKRFLWEHRHLGTDERFERLYREFPLKPVGEPMPTAPGLGFEIPWFDTGWDYFAWAREFYKCLDRYCDAVLRRAA